MGGETKGGRKKRKERKEKEKYIEKEEEKGKSDERKKVLIMQWRGGNEKGMICPKMRTCTMWI